jgi:hypothetical protein
VTVGEIWLQDEQKYDKKINGGTKEYPLPFIPRATDIVVLKCTNIE